MRLLLLSLLGCSSPEPSTNPYAVAPPPGVRGITLTAPSHHIAGDTLSLSVTAADLAPGDRVDVVFGSVEGPGACPFRAQTGGSPCMEVAGTVEILGSTQAVSGPGGVSADLVVPLVSGRPIVYLQAFLLRGTQSATSNVVPVIVTQPWAALDPRVTALEEAPPPAWGDLTGDPADQPGLEGFVTAIAQAEVSAAAEDYLPTTGGTVDGDVDVAGSLALRGLPVSGVTTTAIWDLAGPQLLHGLHAGVTRSCSTGYSSTTGLTTFGPNCPTRWAPLMTFDIAAPEVYSNHDVVTVEAEVFFPVCGNADCDPGFTLTDGNGNWCRILVGDSRNVWYYSSTMPSEQSFLFPHSQPRHARFRFTTGRDSRGVAEPHETTVLLSGVGGSGDGTSGTLLWACPATLEASTGLTLDLVADHTHESYGIGAVSVRVSVFRP